MRRTYLLPKHMRIAMPEIIMYVEKNGKNYLLGKRVNLAIILEELSKGEQFCSRSVISEELYNAFVAEAKRNRIKYKISNFDKRRQSIKIK